MPWFEYVQVFFDQPRRNATLAPFSPADFETNCSRRITNSSTKPGHALSAAKRNSVWTESGLRRDAAGGVRFSQADPCVRGYLTTTAGPLTIVTTLTCEHRSTTEPLPARGDGRRGSGGNAPRTFGPNHARGCALIAIATDSCSDKT